MFGFKKKPVVNSEDIEFQRWLSTVNKAGQFTPDLYTIQQKANHHVFVYNEAMEGHRSHFDLVGNSPYLGMSFTIRHFTMYKKAVGDESFPFILDNVRDIRVNASRVGGELYSLSPKQLIKLDEHCLNTVQFNRVRLKVVIPHKIKYLHEEKLSAFPPIEAWVYVGKRDFWEDLLDGGYHYPVVRTRIQNNIFKVFNNSFFYSVSEHNDFKITSERTVSTL